MASESIPLHHTSYPPSGLPILTSDDDEPYVPPPPATPWYRNLPIVPRWVVYIVPPLVLLWIPGIVGVAAFPNARIWGVQLIWWSAWLSVVWVGWWAALALALLFPCVARWTIGAVAVSSRRYISWLSALSYYIALFLWSLATWISYQPLINIDAHSPSPDTSKSRTVLSFIARLLFGILLCTAVLLAEKFAIQFIAVKFHEKSYADRIEDQKRATQILVALYQNSKDIKAPSDALRPSSTPKGSVLTNAFSGFVEKGNVAFTNLAGELLGSAILQPNSPAAIVADALGSVNKSILLARRIFYSFVRPGKDALIPSNIARFFPSREVAEEAFMLFDKDGNGDATRDEVELACMDCHREQLSIANSMRDLDSAVGRLDNIFMSLYSFIAVLIIAVVLDSQVTTLVAGAGTLILGLSWLIGSSLAEVLTSIIFLFIKHPYDVGDRVIIDGDNYTVKEIMLLSTIFLDPNNTAVQSPHSVLSNKYISNIRRSPTMSETFVFDVAYDTAFEQIEHLRDKMLAFVTAHKRDYSPSFDVNVVDIPGQNKMTLSADIKYKSNWQQGTLKAQRRNRWICTLKQSLSDLQIYGPNGAGKPPAEVAEVQAAAEHLFGAEKPATAFRLSDKNAVLMDAGQNVFGEAEQLVEPPVRPALEAAQLVEAVPPPLVRPALETGESNSSAVTKV